jgi:large subunit ribosomal protein L18
MTKKRLGGRERRHLRIRRKVRGTTERPRLAVFRSNRHIYAQVVDDVAGKVLTGVCGSSKTIVDRVKGDKDEFAESRAVGEAIAKLAADKGITRVIFDRGGYQYHGRVKALADAARKAGLVF